MKMQVSMHTTCVNSKNNAKSNDSDLIFVIRENTRLIHSCRFHGDGQSFKGTYLDCNSGFSEFAESFVF